jgi:hypothetical protein
VIVRGNPGSGRRAAPIAALAIAAAAALGSGAVLVPRRVAAAEQAPAGSLPFPLSGRLTLRAEGKPYVVDGKQVLAAGSVVRVEANVRIVGINGASLDVRGGLKVHGIPGGRVRIERVDFSPTLAPDNEVHFDEADLSGCRFVHAEGAAFEGGLTIENADLSGGAFSVRMRSGYLRVLSSGMNDGCTVVGTPGKGRAPEVAIRSSNVASVRFTGPMTATVRASEVRGSIEARDFTDLVIDTCDLPGGLVLRQGPEGSFSRLQLLKCNLVGGSKIVLHRPTGPRTKMEKVRVEKFHFARADGGVDLSDERIADRIEDGADDGAVSVKAFWQNPQERRHVFR